MEEITMQESNTYYMADGTPFSAGAVYSALSQSPCDVIVGLDFGHGETLAFKYGKDSAGNWDHVLLQCGPNLETGLPSFICYDSEGSPVIGVDASDGENFLPYFKIEPSRWSQTVDMSGHTFGTVIRDFLSGVWRNIILHDDEIHAIVSGESEKTLMIAAGCPSSPLWLSRDSQDAYKHLITEATGCERVEILPESTAAIMLPILGGKGNLDSGIAIYDLGSMTVDFTYICMGKKMIVKSLPLGGSDIDRALLRRILSENGLSDHPLSVPQYLHGCAQVRTAKEKFYRTRRPTRKEALVLTDDAQPVFSVDAGLMKAVLWEDRNLQISESDYQNHSWCECFEKFVERTALLISDNPCGRVLVTGGTSHISDVPEICRKVYGPDRVEIEENPSVTVAKGLCYAKGLETKSINIIPEIKKAMLPVFSQKYTSLVNAYANDVLDLCWPVIVEVFMEKAALNSPCKTSDLMKTLSDRFDVFLRDEGKEKAETMLAERIVHALEACIEPIVNAANRYSAELYKTSIRSLDRPPVLRIDADHSIAQSIDMSVIIRELKVDVEVLKTVFFVALLFGLGIVVIVNPALLTVVVLIGLGMISIEALVEKVQRLMPVISQKNMAKIAKKISSDSGMIKENLQKNILHEAAEKLKNNETLRTSFFGQCNDLLEISIGEILFQVFEEKPLF